MRLKYFIPFILLGIVGCDTTDNLGADSKKEPLVHRFDKEKTPKVNNGTGYDPEVIPETNYPSIFEVDISKGKSKDSNEAKGKKASQVLNIGNEKIKVYDESMGSVNEASLQKLRKQVK